MPDFNRNVEDFLEEIVNLLKVEERDMMKVVKNRLATGIEDDGWAEKKLSEVRSMKNQLMFAQQKGASNKVYKEIQDLHEQAYMSGGIYGETGKFGANFTAMTPDVKLPRSVQALILERQQSFKNGRLLMLRNAEDDYRNIIAETTQLLRLGTKTKKQALQISLNKFADKGITGFVDKTGKNWNLHTYSEMALRTTSFNAARIGALDRVIDAGLNYVQVSSHGNPCPFCAPYDGAVLAINEYNNPENRPLLSDAIANGLFHPNCKHMISGYVEGASIPVKQPYDKQGYLDTQTQRYNERQIRKWKLRHEVALDDDLKGFTKGKVSYYQAKQRDLLKDYESRTGKILKRRYDREAPLRLGKEGQIKPLRSYKKKVVAPKPPEIEFETMDDFIKNSGSKKVSYGPRYNKKSGKLSDALDDFDDYPSKASDFVEDLNYDFMLLHDHQEDVIIEEARRLLVSKTKLNSRLDTLAKGKRRLRDFENIAEDLTEELKDYAKKNNLGRMRDLVRKSAPGAGGDIGEDELMKLYAKLFDNSLLDTPKIISNDLFDKMRSNGELELWRGFGSRLNRMKAFDQGENYFGKGIYGNGTYTAIGRDVATSYDKTYGASNIMSYIIHPNTQFINWDDIQELANIVRNDKSFGFTKATREIFGEEGRLAAALGYDGIYIDKNEYLVMLNRSKFLMKQPSKSKYTTAGKVAREKNGL